MNLTENKFYVYIMFRVDKPKGEYRYGDLVFEYEPFSVGKGWHKRLYDHFRPSHLKSDGNKHKVNIIKKLLNLGFKMKDISKKYKVDLYEMDSLNLEILTIATIGRNDLGLGPLTNMTNGGDGYSGRIF